MMEAIIAEIKNTKYCAEKTTIVYPLKSKGQYCWMLNTPGEIVNKHSFLPNLKGNKILWSTQTNFFPPALAVLNLTQATWISITKNKHPRHACLSQYIPFTKEYSFIHLSIFSNSSVPFLYKISAQNYTCPHVEVKLLSLLSKMGVNSKIATTKNVFTGVYLFHLLPGLDF